MTARNHHFVPQCYLKGFARHRNKPKVRVIDLRQRKTFETNPKNIAAERDFNRVEIAGHPPDAIEAAFSRFESQLAPALDRIIAARSIADEQDRTVILNLVGLMAMRNPRLRETMQSFEDRIFKHVAQAMVATPERWNGVVQQVRESGTLTREHPVDY